VDAAGADCGDRQGLARFTKKGTARCRAFLDVYQLTCLSRNQSAASNQLQSMRAERYIQQRLLFKLMRLR
jgi:hypothetical protein